MLLQPFAVLFAAMGVLVEPFTAGIAIVAPVWVILKRIADNARTQAANNLLDRTAKDAFERTARKKGLRLFVTPGQHRRHIRAADAVVARLDQQRACGRDTQREMGLIDQFFEHRSSLLPLHEDAVDILFKKGRAVFRSAGERFADKILPHTALIYLLPIGAFPGEFERLDLQPLQPGCAKATRALAAYDAEAACILAQPDTEQLQVFSGSVFQDDPHMKPGIGWDDLEIILLAVSGLLGVSINGNPIADLKDAAPLIFDNGEVADVHARGG